MSWVAWVVAALSVGAFLCLWFWDVRRIMRGRKSTVESAASQLKACRDRARTEQSSAEHSEVIARSEHIYRQAVELYTNTLKKPWIGLPARVMGFRLVSEAEELPQVEESDLQQPVALQEPAEEAPQKEKEPYFGSVRFFKNLILLAVIIMIAVPSSLAVYFSGSLQHVEQDLQEQTGEMQALWEEKESLLQTMQTLQKSEKPDTETVEEPEQPEENLLQAETPYAELYPDFYAPQELNATVREDKTIYLTFDDGPSHRTGEILDVLKEMDAKATFFVIGSRDDVSRQMLRRIAEEGHTLAMHSYSHNYEKIYASVEDYLADMYQIFKQIRDETGVTPTLFRFPGGSINGYNHSIYQEMIAEMLRRGFVPFDWNISSEDAATNNLLPSARLVQNVVTAAGKVNRGIVLMHDAESKTTTAQAVGPMIDELRSMGFAIKPLTPEIKPVLYGYRE